MSGHSQRRLSDIQDLKPLVRGLEKHMSEDSMSDVSEELVKKMGYKLNEELAISITQHVKKHRHELLDQGDETVRGMIHGLLHWAKNNDAKTCPTLQMTLYCFVKGSGSADAIRQVFRTKIKYDEDEDESDDSDEE